MAIDPNCDPSSSALDPLADPFRLLGVDPTTTDSAIDIAYSSRQIHPALQDAHAAIKVPTLRLQAYLTYPLDCPPDLLGFSTRRQGPPRLLRPCRSQTASRLSRRQTSLRGVRLRIVGQ